MGATVQSLLLCAAASTTTAIVFGIFRRRVRCELDERSASAVGTVVSFVASLFAFVLGLTVVNLWSRYNEADHLVDQEATRVGMMYDLVAGLPRADKLRQALVTYAKSVAEDEWPAMAHGIMHAPSERLKNEVIAEAMALARHDPDAAVIAQSLVDNAITMNRDRHEREDLLSTSLHPLILVALGASGGFTLIGFFFITITNRRVQFLVDFTMIGTIVLNFYLLQALDHPLNGTGFSVSNEAFAKLHERIKT